MMWSFHLLSHVFTLLSHLCNLIRNPELLSCVVVNFDPLTLPSNRWGPWDVCFKKEIVTLPGTLGTWSL